MTGSPVFKFNPHSIKKQKTRKLDIVVSKSHLNNRLNNEVKISKPNFLLINNAESNSSNPRIPLNEIFDKKTVGSLSSNVSSFVFSNKKGVKRKLEFDDDDESDTSFKYRCKSISLADSQSFRECASPSKKPIRFSGSYSKSSISSVTCRRKLFDCEPDTKKLKLESPVLCKRSNSRRKEIKLSLKKRFPGVPNSDSARSGLLLNLAFSKYNLSNRDKSDADVDFVDNDINTSTKKDFIHYSQLKQDNSSLSNSPVFMAIKKVKRKLNLDRDSNINKTYPLSSADDESKVNYEKIPSKIDLIKSEYNKRNFDNISENTEVQFIKSMIAVADDVRTRQTPNKQVALVSNFEINDSPVDSPTLMTKYRQKNNRGKIDLFKNSKVRSSLKDKIFSLSKNLKEIKIQSSDTPGSSTSDANQNNNVELDNRTIFQNLDEDLSSGKIRRSKCLNKRKFIDVAKTFKIEKKSKDTCRSKRYSKMNNLAIEKPTLTKNTELFLEGHMQRFLKDCLVSVEQHNDDSAANKIETINNNLQNNDDIIEKKPSQSDNFTIPKLCVHALVDSPITPNKLPVIEEITDTQFSKPKEIFSISSCESQILENNFKVEDISTCESNDVQLTEPVELNALHQTPEKPLPTEIDNETLETIQKRRKKNHSPNNLLTRIEKLINREKSEVRMWEYETSKIVTETDLSSCLKSGVFCIEKMWEEYRHIAILCSYVKQDIPDHVYDLNSIKSFGVSISNLVLLYVEPEFCPRNLTYTSIFRVEPPWKILILKKFEPIIMLQPRKMRIISKHGKTLRYKDPTVPDEPVILKNLHYCTCDKSKWVFIGNYDFNTICECNLPDGYLTLMQPLLHSDIELSGDKFESCFKIYNANDLDTASCINKTVIKHKLYSIENLCLDVRILHIFKNDICSELVFWHIICIDQNEEICCVVIEDEKFRTVSHINNEILFRFHGVIPWKLIPTKNISSFIEYIQYKTIPNNIQSKLASCSVYVCVLSNKYGYVKRLNN